MNLKLTALLMWKHKEDIILLYDGYYKQVEFTVGDDVIDRISKKYSNGLQLVEEMELIDLYFSTGGLPAGIKPCNFLGIPDIMQIVAFEYVEEENSDD